MTNLNRRTLLTSAAGLAGLGFLSACVSNSPGTGGKSGEASVDSSLKIGASPVPHAEILQFVKDELAKDAGLDIEIVEYTDYILPNKDLEAGDTDANFYQTPNFLKNEIEENGYKFTAGKGVHIEPLGLYSEKAKSVEEIAEGGEIALNSDPANTARGLRLLESAGLISLGDAPEDALVKPEDVKENPKNLKFTELEGGQIPRSLGDFAAAVINGNFALEAGLKPNKDSLFLEPGEDSPYANLLVWRSEDDGNEHLKKLEELLHSAEVKAFIEKTYTDGSVIPAF